MRAVFEAVDVMLHRNPEPGAYRQKDLKDPSLPRTSQCY